MRFQLKEILKVYNIDDSYDDRFSYTEALNSNEKPSQVVKQERISAFKDSTKKGEELLHWENSIYLAMAVATAHKQLELT